MRSKAVINVVGRVIEFARYTLLATLASSSRASFPMKKNGKNRILPIALYFSALSRANFVLGILLGNRHFTRHFTRHKTRQSAFIPGN